MEMKIIVLKENDGRQLISSLGYIFSAILANTKEIFLLCSHKQYSKQQKQETEQILKSET